MCKDKIIKQFRDYEFTEEAINKALNNYVLKKERNEKNFPSFLKILLNLLNEKKQIWSDDYIYEESSVFEDDSYIEIGIGILFSRVKDYCLKNSIELINNINEMGDFDNFRQYIKINEKIYLFVEMIGQGTAQGITLIEDIKDIKEPVLEIVYKDLIKESDEK